MTVDRPWRVGLRSVALGYLALLLIIPIGLVFYRTFEHGIGAVFDSVTTPAAVSAFWLTITVTAIAVPLNTIFGVLCALALARGRVRGKAGLDAMIDLPFALPTIVAGLTLLALYGPTSPLGIDIAYTQFAVLLALLFVTLPFVIRSVQPVLIELDREMEEAALSLGASNLTVFRRVILPNLVPAMLGGAALAFARAVGEFGSIVLISGNIPFDTQVASMFIFKQIESDNPIGAAAISVVLLILSLLVLFGIRALGRWGARHDR
jgi:sulfate transport system permease protein